ncbi:hypothetical protein DY000_02062706 [Brassica cretica]|uniref:Uncharacterized protein n=1 Tax=Brassica cretica TaxID=69181 RepID=A0ABQ7B0H5_BRACR|nr:hypothetical protein DY000_02062706 [Brassica cretica]
MVFVFAVSGQPTCVHQGSVTENIDCCKHWDSLYKEILEASVAVLKKLVGESKEHSVKISSSQSNALTLNRTMKSFRLKHQRLVTRLMEAESFDDYTQPSMYVLHKRDTYVDILGLSPVIGMLKSANKNMNLPLHTTCFVSTTALVYGFT